MHIGVSQVEALAGASVATIGGVMLGRFAGMAPFAGVGLGMGLASLAVVVGLAMALAATRARNPEVVA